MKMVSCSGENEFTTSTLVSICLEALTIQTNVKKGFDANVPGTYQKCNLLIRNTPSKVHWIQNTVINQLKS